MATVGGGGTILCRGGVGVLGNRGDGWGRGRCFTETQAKLGALWRWGHSGLRGHCEEWLGASEVALSAIALGVAGACGGAVPKGVAAVNRGSDGASPSRG